MNTSEIKSGLDSASQTIANARARLKKCKADISNTYLELLSIPTTYEDLITAINAFTPTGVFEELCQDELSRLVTEFGNLMNDASGASSSLSPYDFE